MDIIKESPLCFTDWGEKGKAGNIYWDPSNDLYVYWELVVAGTWQYIPEALALEIAKIDSLADAVARLQEDLGAVKGRLVTARKRRDKSEKAVKTLQADLHGSLERGEALKRDLANVRESYQGKADLLNRANTELKTTTEALGRAQQTVKEGASTIARQAAALEEAKGDWEIMRDSRDTALEERAVALESPALNPEDVVDLRGTCTVDEVLRMRAAGVL